MKKYIIYIILLIVTVSCKNDETKEYKNGILYKSYTLNGNIEYDGLYKEFYRNGKIKSICNFKNGIVIDSLTTYNEDGSLLNIVYPQKRDTFLCKTFNHNILESLGKMVQTRKIGYWNYYNNAGKVIKKQEFINVCGKHYMNQSWEYDENNQTIKHKGNHYQINLEKMSILLGIQ